MLKVLLKKQLAELGASFFVNRKNGKRRTRRQAIGFIALYAVLLLVLAGSFAIIALSLCGPLTEQGFGWLYFALMTLIAVVLGVFGSVFNTYATLYRAKDNELLLAMPIPPAKILFARMFSVFFWGLIFELIILAPSTVIWIVVAKPGLLGAVFSILLNFVVAFFVLTLSCVLGWVVALVSSRLQNKSIISLLLSLGFIAAYYYLYGSAMNGLMGLATDASSFGASVRSSAWPLWQLGLAAEGDPLAMLAVTALIAALFALTCFVLIRSFSKITTMNRGAAKKVYREKETRVASVRGALLRKEWKRFTSSATYMLNCGLGVILLPVAAILLIVKGSVVRELLPMLFAGNAELPLLIAAAGLCMMAGMIDVSAPSVSLEGKSIWLLQSMPVSGREVLEAKLLLHLLLSVPPSLLCGGAIVWIIGAPLSDALLLLVIELLFVGLIDLAGLALNLKLPNLSWTNEIVPIKQGASVTIALLGGWGLVIVLGGLYYLLRNVVPAKTYALACAVLFALSDRLLLRWIQTKGARIFETL